MEDVLTVYQRPYDPTTPVVCMDEQPVQLVKETRQPIPAAPGRPVRIDYEYERNGTANIFMFTEPLAGWRAVPVTDRRTKVDWAQAVRALLDGRYRGVEVRAWEQSRNEAGVRVNWRFSIDRARVKLHRVYP